MLENVGLCDLGGIRNLAGDKVKFESSYSDYAPGIHLVTVEGSPSEAEFSAFLDCTAQWLSSFHRRGAPARLIVDPSGLTRFDASLRSIYGEWRKENMELIGASCVRAAYIADGAIWRGVMTAIFWFAKPIIPVKTFPTRAAAESWVLE